jgi:hypothetical protein
MTRFAVNHTIGAKGFAAKNTRTPRIGELLIAANVIKVGVLNESLQIAKTSKNLIGNTLISLGQLDEQKLQAALDIQILIGKNLVNTQVGISTLNMACISKISANDALQKLGWQMDEATNIHDNSLAQFMIDAGLVTREVLARADRNLGEILLEQNGINASQLDSAWQAQRMIDDRMISFAYACAALRKLTRNSRPSQLKYPQELQQITEPDLPIISQENWLTK